MTMLPPCLSAESSSKSIASGRNRVRLKSSLRIQHISGEHILEEQSYLHRCWGSAPSAIHGQMADGQKVMVFIRQ